jgi:antitoxin YobK
MNFDDAKKIIARHPDMTDFVGPTTEQEVRDAEKRLGVTFSRSYLAFLREFGCGNFGAEEFLGVGVEPMAVPSVIWYTETTRRKSSRFPKHYVPVYDVGLGEVMCLDTSQLRPDGECPVVRWVADDTSQSKETIASSFGEFFAETIKEEAET